MLHETRFRFPSINPSIRLPPYLQNSNSPLKFSIAPEAAIEVLVSNVIMYCTDIITGETRFHFPGREKTHTVFLEMVAGGRRLRVRMERSARDWVARAKLPCGWCFYWFEVDGKPQWDRAVGKMKTQDGQPCSLAMISTGSAQPHTSPNPQ